jgi:hypothetical protein
MTAYLVTPIVGLALLATVTTACSSTNVDTVTPATTGKGAVGASEGSALAKDTQDPKESNASLAKGELMGTGVGAAAGALYDVKKRRPQ